MVRINLKRPVNHVPHGQIHGIDFVPGEQDVHEKDAETFIREGWADPLDGAAAPAPATTPAPDQPSPDSGQAQPSSASRPAPASPKPRRKPAAKRKPPAKPG